MPPHTPPPQSGYGTFLIDVDIYHTVVLTKTWDLLWSPPKTRTWDRFELRTRRRKGEGCWPLRWEGTGTARMVRRGRKVRRPTACVLQRPPPPPKKVYSQTPAIQRSSHRATGHGLGNPPPPPPHPTKWRLATTFHGSSLNCILLENNGHRSPCYVRAALQRARRHDRTLSPPSPGSSTTRKRQARTNCMVLVQAVYYVALHYSRQTSKSYRTTFFIYLFPFFF